MKKIILSATLVLLAGTMYGQTIYYWVGGTTPTTSITTGSNWNTALNGTGSTRPSSTGASDILIFDGSNVGGATPTTGPVTVLANGSITCAQLKFTNNVTATFLRASSGTSTITISGEAGEDFVIDAGSTLNLTSQVGSLRFAMNAANTGRVSGTLVMVTPLQARFDNTTGGSPGSFVFTSGSSFTTNITSASSSYAFGGNTQSTEKWVVFEDGSHLYYTGGFSPMGNVSTFSAIDMRPGSTWHHRANNPATGFGTFFNRKSFGNIIVENNAVATAEGTIYRINNLTVQAGSSFILHSSGQTALMGNLIVDGTLSAPAGSTNELIFAGNTPQNVSGSGTIDLGGLNVSASAHVNLNRNVSADQSVMIIGRINFNNFQLSGDANFTAEGVITPIAGTGNTLTGSYLLTGNTGITTNTRGKLISGAGIAPNTVIVSFSTTADTIYLSQPLTATATGVSVTVSTSGAVLSTSNSNGFDPLTGSVIVAGNKIYRDHIHYIINGATSTPFGISTGSSATKIISGRIEVHADITANASVEVNENLLLDGKFILRPLDSLHIVTGATITGTFNSSHYIATGYSAATGEQAIIQYDGMGVMTTIPSGTVNYYLPVTLTPSTVSDFSISVFEGITSNGLVNGTPLSASQRQRVVNAVWNINRLSGSGTADLQLGWNTALEGSTFITLPDSDIGLITNTGTSWSLPTGVGDNTLNIVTDNISNFGSFSAGAVPPSQPFVFNPLPVKTYGDADFNGGASSLNTTHPIIYTSSNASVATIVNGDIHITGAGTTNITASQDSDGFYPAASVTQSLTVNKAELLITADDKLKFEGQPNPVLTVTYTGFVLGETATVLTTAVSITTTATLASPPGTYPIEVSGATSANYNISFVNGILTVQPRTNQVISFNPLPVKTYGNADFPAGATSTNNTIPITYTSSNTSVATVTGNIIHITGAGTTTITASQAGSVGYFPAANVEQVLTVNKVNLTVRVRDTSKIYGQPNPDFVMTYTGFVLGENASSLTTAPVIATSATTNSAPGYYTLTPQGGVSQNYNFIYVPGRLTIFPGTGTNDQYINVFMRDNQTINVRVYSVKPALGDVLVYDMNGRLVKKKNLFMPIGFINTDLLVPAMSAGIYTIVVRGAGVELKKTIYVSR